MHFVDLFLFKQKSNDFMVEEILPFALTHKGDALFVQIEKRNITTMDIINHLKTSCKLSRQHIGIAGLKDKDAITKQWISIRKSALEEHCNGEAGFITTLAEVCRVIQSDRHTKPIGMTDQIQNTFFIRLRAKKNLSTKERESTQGQVSKLFTGGFANSFGPQRFGVNGRNVGIAKDILDKKTSIADRWELQFKLQAYGSFLFNQYVKARLKCGLTPMEGELYQDANGTIGAYSSTAGKAVSVDQLLGLVPGWDLKLPAQGTEARAFVDEFIQREKITPARFKPYQDMKIFALLRPWWVFPKQAKYRWEDDDLVLQFTLPGGSYASVMIGV